MLRLNEAEEVQTVFAKHFGIKLITVDAQEQFFNALSRCKMIQKKNVKSLVKNLLMCLMKQAEKITNVKWLAQGTIYSDVIESAATKRVTRM